MRSRIPVIGKQATTPNEREALGIDYADYFHAREETDRARKRYLKGQWFKRHGKGYKNRHTRRAGLAEARRERRREHRAQLRAEKRERFGSNVFVVLDKSAAEMIAKRAGDV